jgi:hypothetical protein
VSPKKDESVAPLFMGGFLIIYTTNEMVGTLTFLWGQGDRQRRGQASCDARIGRLSPHQPAPPATHDLESEHERT